MRQGYTENDVTSDNPVSDWKNIVYRTAKGKYAIVSDEVVFYASLEDAVAGKNPEKAVKLSKKSVDLPPRLCYSMDYLSDERFIFARFFVRKRAVSLQYREAMPALTCG